MPYLNVYRNRRHVNKLIRPYSENISKRDKYKKIINTVRLAKPYSEHVS